MKKSNERAAWPAFPEMFLRTLLLALLLAIAGCGGGGGGGEAAAPAGGADAAAAAADGGNSRQTVLAAQNAVPVTVNAGPANTINIPFVSVTICQPGNSAQCRTVDNVIVDTGSTGLRLFASALGPSLSLPDQTDASGAPLAECMQFVDSSIWGALKLADVRLGGEQAASIPVQILGDPGFAGIPADCASTGRVVDNVQEFGGNGILGVGIFEQDCGSACERLGENGIYYSCPGGVCRPTSVAVSLQMQQPVARFAGDNNGVLLTFPAVPQGGAPGVTGQLVFGIGTQANNALGAAKVITLDSRGLFTTVYKGQPFTQSFIDSGSNALFFFDSEIPPCQQAFYCPPTPLTQAATQVGANGATSPVSFTVANAVADVGHLENTAFGELAGPIGSTSVFDWGLPFFYGRSVFTAIEGRGTPGGVGPYFAY